MLARRTGYYGWTGRPGLSFRFRADCLPPLPLSPYSCAWHSLEGFGWGEWAEAFREVDRHWKYVDVMSPNPDHPLHVRVVLRGYTGLSVRPELPQVAELIHALQARGIRVEVE